MTKLAIMRVPESDALEDRLEVLAINLEAGAQRQRDQHDDGEQFFRIHAHPVHRALVVEDKGTVLRLKI